MKLRAHSMRCAMAFSATLLFTLPATAQTYQNGCTGAPNLLAYKQDWTTGVAPNAMPNTPYMGQSGLYYQNTVWGGSNPVDPQYPELAATESVTVSTGTGPNGANVIDFNPAGTTYYEDYQTAGAVFGGFGPIPDSADGSSWWDATEGCVSVAYKWTTAAWNQIASAPLVVLGKDLYWGGPGGLSLVANVSGNQGTVDLGYTLYNANSPTKISWAYWDTYPFTRIATENQWQQFAVLWKNGSTDDAVSGVASDGWVHVYWNGTLIYDVNDIPLIMNPDPASALDGKPNRLRTLWLGYFGLFGPAANLVLTNEPPSWNTTRQLPYFGYYAVETNEGTNPYNYINELSMYSNLAIMSPDTNVYSSGGTPTTVADQYNAAGTKLIVYLGISEQRLNHPFDNSDANSFQQYLGQVYDELNDAHLLDNVIAFAPGEEWNTNVVDGDQRVWAPFNGITAQNTGDCSAGPNACWIKARRDLLVTMLNDVIAAIRAKFPGKQIIGVDTHWNNDYAFTTNPRDYHPVPNVDILGIDAYMGFKHTVPQTYTTDCGPDMQAMFTNDVKKWYDHALAEYQRPILAIGQAFESNDWPMTSNCQLNWWYSLAQSHSRYIGLAWFAYGLYGESGDNAMGVRTSTYTDQKIWLWNMYRHNQALPGGAPDLLSQGQVLLPNESRTSIDGRFHLVYQGDGNLVLYNESWVDLWSSGTNDNNPGHAVMQSEDGNFVIYNGDGVPVWWTATEYSRGAYLVVQPDGNVVVYSGASPNAPLWSTETCCQ